MSGLAIGWNSLCYADDMVLLATSVEKRHDIVGKNNFRK